ncbi:MAG TPA: DNA alkylation repair protein [Terriglobales bacterium]|nr:DNA alkylation repair protein [Terriglobales bacterium]
MPATAAKSARSKPKAAGALAKSAKQVVAELKRLADKKTLTGMARYGLPSDKAFGVPVNKIQALGKRLGRNHQLAADLWQTGWHEARMLAAFVDDPAQVTPAQMDRWCRDFDNWGICDTVCFHLFDCTPHAFARVTQWSKKSGEFQKRAAFALLACLALHDKQAPDEHFIRGLALIEGAATDERNFVKKGVSWALRLIGRRNRALNSAAVKLAQRLAASPGASARWIGKGAVKELTSPAVLRRLKP